MKNILANLSLPQKITIAVVLLAAGGGVYLLVQHQREADFRPLFTGVAPEDASAIVQKLKAVSYTHLTLPTTPYV